MYFPTRTIARVGRRVPLNVCGAALIHLGIVGLFLAGPSVELGGRPQAGRSFAGAIPIGVVASTAAAQAPADRAPASHGSAPSREPEAADTQDLGARSPSYVPAKAAATVGAAGPAAPGGYLEGSGVSAADAPDSELALDYQRKLRVHILSFFRYPDEAARNGAPDGGVQLRFEVDRTGRVRQVWVEHSSGSDVLDEAALDTLRRAAPLPPIPSGLPDRLTVRVPLLFNANG